MTDEEIIKAVKHCITHNTSCKPCPYCFTENGELRCNAKQRKRDILDMINRLKAENANLTVENEVLKRDVYNLERTLEKGKEDVERVRKETAKEILQSLLECSEMVETNPDGEAFPFVYTENIFSLAKKYGVEVEE